MKRFNSLFAMLLLASFGACDGGKDEAGSEQAALQFGYGEWEITIKTTVDGLVAPDSVIHTCVNLDNPAPGFELTPSSIECQAKSRLKGKMLSWEQECSYNELVWETVGKAKYDGDTFAGTMTHKENGKLFSTAVITGVRVGDC